MKQPKQYQAHRLLDAIGGIQDSYLDEALQYRTSRPPVRHTLRNLLAVAALAAVLILTVTGPLSRLLNRDTAMDPPPAENNNTPITSPTLSALLEKCTESPSFTLSAADEINFFDGNVRLTVENRSSGELFVSRPLSATEQSTVLSEFQASGKQVAANASPEGYRVWVMLGDGSVVTPCLDPTAGNVGCGVLFDYEEERVPTELFLNLLTRLQ